MNDSPKVQRKNSVPENRTEHNHSDSSLAPPIFQTATFTFESTKKLASYHVGESTGFFYTRYGNPTLAAAEARLSRLEGAEASTLYASGMAAISSVFFSLLGTGARLVLLGETYRHTQDFASGLHSRYGVNLNITSENTPEALESLEEGPVRVLFVEIPSNPTLRVPNMAQLTKWAQDRGAKLIVDSTIASPILFRPLEHGADLVIHSATKFLGGHNDLLAGGVSGSKPIIDALTEQRALLGTILSPHTAYLLDRGMKTLGVRVERQSATALRLAEFLCGCKQVKKVHYPGLKSHPDHQTARTQMKAFGGLLSFELEGGPEAADRLVDSLQVPLLAAGFGGTESQVEHHALMAYADLGLEGARARGVPPGLVRYSVGLEDSEILRDDLADGLKCI